MGWYIMRSKLHVSVWQNGFVNCLWGIFGKRDLADLTETIMGDVNRMEHVWSHVLGYLYGAYISTAIIAVCLFVYDWRLAIACLWGVPVAFGLLFGSRKIACLQCRTDEKSCCSGIRWYSGSIRKC